MKRKWYIFSVALIVILVLNTVSSIAGTIVSKNVDKLQKPRLIAHAGGSIYGIRLTNSLQALDNSYKHGFRYFELDMDWSTDGIPVLSHDWTNTNWLADIRYSAKPHTYSEFKSMKGPMGLQFLDLDMLENWLKEHKDAFIVTDVKSDNVKMLTLIKNRYLQLYKQAIVQIYAFDEYEKVKNLGYQEIILTFYKLTCSETDIINFCKGKKLFSLTMHQDKATKAYIAKFQSLNIPIYIHDVNDYNVYVRSRDYGAYGVYTDYYMPDNWIEN